MIRSLLSDETYNHLFALSDHPEALVKLLRLIERDASNEGVIRDHDRVNTLIANCIEGGVAPLEALRSARLMETYYPVQPKGYVRRVPSDWAAIRARIFERDGERCRYCEDTEGPFHIDHIHPLRRGGSNDDDNLCVACATCNTSKKDSTVQQWRARCS